jgi:uncharacterized damage-inducible protein DinB
MQQASTTLVGEIRIILLRDLNTCISEIESYPDESSLWKLDGTILNTAGNLALHLAGNLQHFIGAILGKTDYIRNREAEFADKHIPREKIISELRRAATAIDATLSAMQDADLSKTFPSDKFMVDKTIHFALLHLMGHLNYHLGQINYHRRLLS